MSLARLYHFHIITLISRLSCAAGVSCLQRHSEDRSFTILEQEHRTSDQADAHAFINTQALEEACRSLECRLDECSRDRDRRLSDSAVQLQEAAAAQAAAQKALAATETDFRIAVQVQTSPTNALHPHSIFCRICICSLSLRSAYGRCSFTCEQQIAYSCVFGGIS